MTIDELGDWKKDAFYCEFEATIVKPNEPAKYWF